jgi:flavin-dependent dehydrogenase
VGVSTVTPLREDFDVAIVGADGPSSAVARAFGLGRNQAFLAGVETEYRGVGGVDPDRLHCFADSRLARGYIAWVVPGVDGVTQVGLAARRPDRLDLRAFEQKISGLFDFTAARPIARRGGLIPIGGRVEPFAAERVLLAGDAAGLVSPLTAGGLRWLADLPPPNGLYDALLGTAPARHVASAIYFHRRSASMTDEQEDGYSRSADR